MASTIGASNAIVLEVLDQHNYDDWSSRVQTYLLAEDLWDVVKAEPPKPEDKAWTTKNAKALHAIKISCGTCLFSFIRDTPTAKMAWEVLEREFKSFATLSLERKEREKREGALHTPINVAGKTRDEGKELVQANEALEIKASEGGNEKNVHYAYDSSYDCFFNYVMDGDWDQAKECLATLHPDAIRARRPHDGSTALQLAAWKGHVQIIKELTPLMTEEDLEIQNNSGYTALHLAVYRGNVDIVKELVSSIREEALEIKDGYDATPLGRAVHVSHNGVDEGDAIKMAKYMVEKNKKILTSFIGYYNYIPVVEASCWERWKLTHYLYSVTPLEALMPPENGSHGASLICYCLRSKQFDIAWNLLSRCPSLTMGETVCGGGNSPILSLVRMHSAFLRDMRLRFWQKWIYDRTSIQPSADSNIHDISINVSNSEDNRGNQPGLISSVMGLLRRLVKDLLELLGIKRIYEMKATHARIFELISCMGKETINELELTLAQTNRLGKSMWEAIEQGNIEFVTQMCKANPNLIEMVGDKRMSIFHFAIVCRQEEIYSLIYGLKQGRRNKFGLQVASFNNSMLHGAATFSPLPQFNRIQRAHLQMQRELQWFKEVESVVPIAMHESRNHSENLTARELFHQNHKKLMEEAELSMKGTSSSCAFIACLIVTMMFAAAFKKPSRNHGNTGGRPMFMDEILFLVYTVSVTTALVSSTTAVITFLRIITSRYSEEDYLKSLPTKMMIGFCTLFISIVTMMTAFCCDLVIMLHGRYSWVTIPSILIASIPVIAFMWMLFPLIVQTFTSTYGPGIFNKKVKPWIEF